MDAGYLEGSSSEATVCLSSGQRYYCARRQLVSFLCLLTISDARGHRYGPEVAELGCTFVTLTLCEEPVVARSGLILIGCFEAVLCVRG